MKRNYVSTFCEFFFPLILMCIILYVRVLVKKEEFTENPGSEDFLKKYSISTVDPGQTDSISKEEIKDAFPGCSDLFLTGAGVFNENPLTDKVLEKLPKLNKKVFASEEDLNNYARDPEFSFTADKPLLCFGFSVSKTTEGYDYTIKYYTSDREASDKLIPHTRFSVLDGFQTQPKPNDFTFWKSSGALYLVKTIQEVILEDATNIKSLKFSVFGQYFGSYTTDDFPEFLDFLITFILVVTYSVPVSKYCYQMANDKETKLKEGMKIMGLTESIYFLSYFLYYTTISCILSLLMALIVQNATKYIGFGFLFLLFFSYGMSVFSLIYFFQSFVTKTRICVMMGIMVYFIMFFISTFFFADDISYEVKQIVGLLPPANLILGNQSIVRYEYNFTNISFENWFEREKNYSFGNMILTFWLDFFIYMFLGFYLQNVIPQTFGQTRKWNFLFDVNYWKSEKASKSALKEESNDNLQIKELKKVFGDGKVAVDGLSLEIYQNEIFALLGHNGAGKSTTLSILSGLFPATSGAAFFKGKNILEEMEEIRKNLGICPQHDVLFSDLTVREHLNLYCTFKGVKNNKEEINKIMKQLELDELEDRMAKNLSGGQKRRLSVAIALVGGSKVVLLDEPTSGMDITNRRMLWDILKGCTEGRIVILTTHYMEEAAILGNRIGIMSKGKLKCCGNTLELIDKYGEFVNLNLTTTEDADKKAIVKFFSDRVKKIESKILNEEVLVRISKDCDLKELFKDLDENIKPLGIKNYGASMPTLEDVFLNTSDDVKKPENVEITEEPRNPSFWTHIKVCLKKRSLLLLRDSKSAFYEIIAPIILVFCGIMSTFVTFVFDPPEREVNTGLLGSSINIPVYYANESARAFFKDSEEVTHNFSQLDSFNYFKFQSEIDQLNKQDRVLGGIFLEEVSDSSLHYYVTTNLVGQDAPIILSHYTFNQVLSHLSGKTAKFHNNPFPLEFEVRERSNTRRDSNLLFFISIGLAMMPANIVSIIIKERTNNHKQLQLINGISLTAYWLSNLIFEFLKFYLFAGVSLICITTITDFEDVHIFFLLYGLTLIPYTYVLSFFFKDEGNAQNFVLTYNFLFGTILSSVNLTLVILEDTVNLGKDLAWWFKINPAFSFAYGSNLVNSKEAVFFISEGPNYRSLDLDIFSMEYAGSDILFLCLWAIVSFSALFLIEVYSYRVRIPVKTENPEGINDEGVLLDIDKANKAKDQYSLVTKNLYKKYTGCVAVDRLSICLEKGECFALLGTNGAGKSTTFKCLTTEVSPTGGSIQILGKSLFGNFDEIRKNIGYCPQNDSFFEFMTVRENLELYCYLRGFSKESTERIVARLMKQMNIEQYENKISGKLSGGNKRKLSVAISLVGEPEIILLDEPSSGMDPEARRGMWEIIHRVCDSNKKATVVLTTHSMEEAETLCRRIGIMVKGQFKCLGSFQNIKDRYGEGYEIDFTLKKTDDREIYARLLLEEHETLEEAKVFEKLEGHRLNVQSQIKIGSIGHEIAEELQRRKKLRASKLVSWIYNCRWCLEILKEIKKEFEEVVIVELYGGSFKIKVKGGNKTIGWIFYKLEEMVRH